MVAKCRLTAAVALARSRWAKIRLRHVEAVTGQVQVCLPLGMLE